MELTMSEKELIKKEKWGVVVLVVAFFTIFLFVKTIFLLPVERALFITLVLAFVITVLFEVWRCKKEKKHYNAISFAANFVALSSALAVITVAYGPILKVFELKIIIPLSVVSVIIFYLVLCLAISYTDNDSIKVRKILFLFLEFIIATGLMLLIILIFNLIKEAG